LPVTISGDATATLFDPQPNGSARCFLGWNGGGAGNSEARITLSASWPPGYQGRGRVVYVAGPPYSPASTPAYLVLDFQIQNGSLTISSPIHISGGVPTTVDDAMQIWAPGHTVYSFAFTPNQ
jgi:hypothetical protein